MIPFKQQPLAELPSAPDRKHRFYDADPRTLTIDGGFGEHSVHVRVFGAGPPLLLVHGLMTHSYSWRYLFGVLGERYTCYAPDLVGCGRSDAPDGDHRPAALCRWLSEVIDALGIRGCPTIGNSMGGYLCMHLAMQDPTAMGCLVNLHAPGIPTARMWALHFVMRIPGAQALLRQLVWRDAEQWAHHNVHYYDESLKSIEEAREYALPLKTRAGIRAFARYLGQTMSPFEMNALNRLLQAGFPIPLQLVYATEDPMVPPWIGERLAARIPAASLVRLDRASHFAHVDATERFAEAVVPFLATVRGAGSADSGSPGRPGSTGD
ncbi:MAG: alpha/beta hydrolase [Myxococcota bacterium]